MPITGVSVVTQLLTVPTLVVLIAAIVAALTDVVKFKVYNFLTVPLMIAGLVYHGFTGGPSALVGSALGLLLGGGLLMIFFLMGGMGGGDVKLMAAIGAWLGIVMTLY